MVDAHYFAPCLHSLQAWTERLQSGENHSARLAAVCQDALFHCHRTPFAQLKVLPHVSRLSRVFQKEDVDFTLLRPCVDATLAAVSLYNNDDLKEVDSTL